MLNIDELHEEERWFELRDRLGRLFAKYDPFSEMLEIRQRGETVRFPLSHYHRLAESVETTRQPLDNYEQPC